MAETRLRIGKQLAKSASARSILITDASSEAAYYAPVTGADTILFWDDSATNWAQLTIGDNLSITGTTLNASAGAGGYAEIQEEGTPLTVRTKMNFVGSGITAADDVGNTRTNITLATKLNNLADLATTGIIVHTGTDAVTARTITGTTDRITVTNGDGVSANPTIDIANTYAGQTSIVTLGTVTTGTWQATTIGPTYGGTGLTTYTTGDMLYASSTNTLAKLGIGTPGYVLRVNSGGTAPEWTSVLDLGFSTKQSVRAATTANINLSNPGTDTFDGITLTSGQRLLVKNQSTTADNGIYTFNGSASALTRTTDADAYAELVSAYVWVEEGSTLADTGWLCISDQGGTLGVTAITWTQQSGAATITAGAGLTKTGNTIDAVAGDTSITVNADEFHVNLATNSGLQVSSGLKILPDTTTANTVALTLTSNGAGVLFDSNTLTESTEILAVKTQMSITSDASGLKLSGDASSPGNSYYYGTNGSGTKGWFTLPTGTIDGTGSANKIAYWLDTDTLTFDSNISVVAAQDQITAGVIDIIGGTGFIQANSGGILNLSSSNGVANGTIDLRNSPQAGYGGVVLSSVNAVTTNGVNRAGTFVEAIWNPTTASATGTWSALKVSATINDTGSTADQDTYSVHIEPVALTAVTGDYTALYIPSVTTTGVAGAVWGIRSDIVSNNRLYGNTIIGSNSAAPAQTLHVQGTARITGSTGTPTVLMGRDANGDIAGVNLGEGISLTGGSLSVTGLAVVWGYIENSTATTIDLDANVGEVKDRNGNNIAFTTPSDLDKLEVYRNGMLLARTGTGTTRDYSINAGTHEITFSIALASDEIVLVKKYA